MFSYNQYPTSSVQKRLTHGWRTSHSPSSKAADVDTAAADVSSYSEGYSGSAASSRKASNRHDPAGEIFVVIINMIVTMQFFLDPFFFS